MKRHLILATIISLALVFCITGCVKNDASKDSQNKETTNQFTPITVEDKDGNEISIENEPKRVISLGPNMTA